MFTTVVKFLFSRFWLVLMAFATALIGLGASEASAADFGRGGSRGGHDGHGGGVSVWFAPAPMPTYYRSVVVAPAPVMTRTIVVPAPQIITTCTGAIVQRTYFTQNGVLVYTDNIIQPAPVIVQPAPVIYTAVPAPTPTWLNVVRGLGVSVRW